MSPIAITPHLFEAFLKCKTKCWLRSSNAPATGNTYAEWFQAKSNSYRIENANRMLETMPETERAVSPDMTKLKTASWRLATSILVRTPDETSLETGSSVDRGGKTSYRRLPTNDSKLADQRLLAPAVTKGKTQQQMTGESCLHAVERIPSEGRGKPTRFIPFRFIFTNKLGKDDKLLLAFDALILSQVLGREVSLGKIVHGDDHAMMTVKISAMLGEVRKRFDTIATLLGSLTPPDLVLNPHCADCEFQGRCRKVAMEKDDLSLLAGMTDKHRKKFHSKGIFTVTQLSYTFRPRRRPKRLRNKRDKYYHSLKALAIREKKIHIVGRPELKIEGTPVYFDVEGVPDRDFYYLIGVRVGSGEFVVQHHLWAGAAEDEERGWRELLAILECTENPVLVYYGNFEKTFWKRMCERYGEPTEGSRAAKAMSSGINLVQFFSRKSISQRTQISLKKLPHGAAFRGLMPACLAPIRLFVAPSGKHRASN